MPATNVAQPMTGVKELRTVDDAPTHVGGSALTAPERATAPAAMLDSGASMFERLARDPSVDVDKLERLMAMHERSLTARARAEYYADFAQMQGDLPTVEERGMTNNGAYARHEDIVEAVRPVLKKYGFILTFRTTFPDGSVRVIGVLAHRSGYAEETEFLSKPDVSGNKNAIQALGSAQQYGQRYTTRALLNIASSVAEDDGRKAGSPPKPEQPKAPVGFDEWWIDLQATADNGLSALDAVWSKSRPEFKNYALKWHGAEWNGLKTKGARVAAS